MAIFFTIGYQNIDLESFLFHLDENDIEVLVDVRELPLSRRKGFSKSSLKTALEVSGIDYEHYRDLGSPRELRNRLKHEESFDFMDFAKHYKATFPIRKHLLEQISQLTEHKRVCLMCFEREAEACHRSILSEEMIKLSKGASTVVHL